MKSRKPLRTRKPWQSKIAAYERAKPEREAARASGSAPHGLEQSKFAVAARSRGMCEAPTPDCQPGTHRAHHYHHIRPRSQGRDHRPANLLHVCSDAHGYIHRHPKESYANGWLTHPDRTISTEGPFFKAGMLDDDD